MSRGDSSRDVRLVEGALALHPKSVAGLWTICHSKDPSLSKEHFLEAVRLLNDEDRLSLQPPRFTSFGGFLTNPYWNTSMFVVIVVSVSEILLYFLVKGFPWSLLKIIPGVLLVFYLPGHSLLRVLLNNELEEPLERVVLEIAVSIVMVLLVGLAINFLGLGLFSAPAVASTVVLNVLLAIWASYEDFSAAWLKGQTSGSVSR